MQYINANDVLPEHLLNQIKQFIPEGLVYIPPDSKKPWGSQTKTRDVLETRNNEIRHKKSCGMTISELMEEYRLSYDTIKKIVYNSHYKKPL